MFMKKLIYILMVLVLLVPACDKTATEAQILVERGRVLLDAGYPQDALELYQKAFVKDPNCSDAYLQTAILYDEYLNDQTNAIIAYGKFLSISDNSVMRKKVQTWLLEIRKGKDGSSDQTKNINSKITNSDFQSDLTQRGNQFKILRKQLVERYETKLEILNQKILKDSEKLIFLENENNILRRDFSKKEILKFVDTISSNEILIANLGAKLEEEKQENKTAIQSMNAMQNMVTELQNKSFNNSENLFPVSTMIETNSLLAAEIEILSLKLKTLETKNSELEQDLLSNQKTSLAQTAETYSSANFKSLIFATNKIAQLKQKNYFLSQANENLITELFKTRKLSESKNTQLVTLNKKYIQVQKSLISSKSLQKKFVEEEKSRANWKKLFYDRTVSLKKLKQHYDNLYKRYQHEQSRNQKINDTITSIQNDLSAFKSKPAKSKPGYSQNNTRQKTYTVRKKDSLATIARHFYDDSQKWNLIFQANRNILNRPNELRIGQTLIIP